MSITYSRESGSQFPDSLLNLHDFKDVDDSIKDIIKQYYALINKGDIDGALALKNTHSSYLKDYWISAVDLNLIKEEIQNIGIYAKKKHGIVVSETEPDIDYDVDTLWIQPI